MTGNDDRMTDERMSSLLSTAERDTAEPDKAFLEQLRQRSADAFAAASDAGHSQSEHGQSMSTRVGRSSLFKTLVPLAAAAVIAIILTAWPGTPSYGLAWAEVVQKTEQSQEEYINALKLAIEKRDLKEIQLQADALDEFWQALGHLAKTADHPRRQAAQLEILKRHHADQQPSAHKAGIQVFVEHADQFVDWLGKIEDHVWIDETAHVCKQLEEYAEETRDAELSDASAPTKIEHYLPSLISYCQWFDALPWQDPTKKVEPRLILTAIERDLQVARREAIHPTGRDGERYISRCLKEIRKNIAELQTRLPDGTQAEVTTLSKKLAEQADTMAEYVKELTKVSWESSQETGANYIETLYDHLLADSDTSGQPAGSFMTQLDAAIATCNELLLKFDTNE